MTKFILSGTSVTVDADADTPLLWVIRDRLGLTGTTFGCGFGMCGPCIVHLDGHAIAARKDAISAPAIFVGTMVGPRSASSLAVANPIAPAAPVIRATLPVIDWVIWYPIRVAGCRGAPCWQFCPPDAPDEGDRHIGWNGLSLTDASGTKPAARLRYPPSSVVPLHCFSLVSCPCP